MYQIEVTDEAERQLAELPERFRRQVVARIRTLAANPRPAGVVFLRGEWAGYYRIRSGNYRVIYTVKDDVLLVVIVRIGHRRDVYD